jgi:Na+/H+ antiporter NhaD/arsenite permease-like protein
VFLQQTYRAELPQLPFLTFLDQVYVVAYVVTLVAFVLVLWIGRRYGDMEDLPEGPDREQMERRLTRLDELWPLLVVVFSSLTILLCWLSIPSSS